MKKKKIMALAITDVAVVIYFIIEMSCMPLECECERLTFDDWLFLGPIAFVTFGVCLLVGYYILEHIVRIVCRLYRKK